MRPSSHIPPAVDNYPAHNRYRSVWTVPTSRDTAVAHRSPRLTPYGCQTAMYKNYKTEVRIGKSNRLDFLARFPTLARS